MDWTFVVFALVFDLCVVSLGICYVYNFWDALSLLLADDPLIEEIEYFLRSEREGMRKAEGN